MEALAAELVSFLGEQGPDRPHVAGNSLGGVLALGLAAYGRAASAAALSPAGFWRRDSEFRWAKAIFKIMEVASAGDSSVASVLSRNWAGPHAAGRH